MSSLNVELARQGYEAISRGDLEAVRPLLAPNVRWHGGDPDAPGACRGREEALQYMRAARQRGAVPELVDVIDAGDRVVVILQPPAAQPGLAPPPRRANVTTFRDGRVIEMVAHESPEAALAAAGVTRSGC